MIDVERIVADLQVKLAETQLAILESALGEQRHKTVKAEAEARYALIVAELAERHASAVEMPKVTIGGKRIPGGVRAGAARASARVACRARGLTRCRVPRRAAETVRRSRARAGFHQRREAALSAARGEGATVNKNIRTAVSDPLSWIDTELSPLASREQLQKCSGLSLRTIDRALASGEITAVRIGRRVLIPRSSVRQWLARGLT